MTIVIFLACTFVVIYVVFADTSRYMSRYFNTRRYELWNHWTIIFTDTILIIEMNIPYFNMNIFFEFNKLLKK